MRRGLDPRLRAELVSALGNVLRIRSFAVDLRDDDTVRYLRMSEAGLFMAIEGREWLEQERSGDNLREELRRLEAEANPSGL